MAEEAKKKKEEEGNTLGAGANMEAPDPVRGNDEVGVATEELPNNIFSIDLGDQDELDYAQILPFGELGGLDDFDALEGTNLKPLPTQSSIGSHVLEGLGYDMLDGSIAESFKELDAIQNDTLNQRIQREELLSRKIEGITDDISASAFVEEFKKDLLGDPKPRTIGTIYTDMKFPTLPNSVKGAVAAGIDIRLTNNRNNMAMANLMEFDTLAEATGLELGITIEVPESIRNYVKSLGSEIKNRAMDLPGIVLTTTSKPFAKPLFDLSDVIHPEAGARFERLFKGVSKDIERRKRINKKNIEEYGEPVGSLFNAIETATEFVWAGVHMQDRFMAAVKPEDPHYARVATLGDWFNWVSLLPDNPEREVDYTRIWDTWMKGDPSDVIHEEMAARYGEDWGWRFVAFMVKEFGVDAALYASGMVFRPIKEIIEAAKGARFFSVARAKSIFTRASVIGVGGGIVQAGLEKSAEGNPSFAEEILLRVGGFAAAEVVLAGIAAPFAARKAKLRERFLENAKKVADELQVSTLPPRAVREAQKINPDVPELLTLQRVAAIFEATAEVRRTARFVATAIVRELRAEHNIPLRRKLLHITGLKDEELETHVVAAQHIFGNIHRKADFEEAQKLLKVANKSLVALKAEKDEVSKEIRRLEKRVKAVKTPEAKARHREALKEQRSSLSRLVSSIERETKAKEGQEAIVKSLEDLNISSGSPLADMVATAEAVGFRVTAEDVMASNGQAVNDLFFANVDIANGVVFRTPMFHWNEKGKLILDRGLRDRALGIFRALGEPDHVLPITSIAENFLDTWHHTKRFQRLMRSMYAQATKGLTAEERTAVYTILQNGSDAKKLWTVPELSRMRLSPQAIQGYYDIRKVLDLGHLFLDIAYTRNLKSQVLSSGLAKYQVLPDGRLVQIGDGIQHGLKKEQIEQGLVKYRVVPRSNAESIEEGFIGKAELRPLVSAIPVERGYIPRTYRDANYHISKIDLKTGKMERAYVGKNWAETEAKRKQLEQAEGSGDVIWFADKWDSISNRTTVAFPKKGVQLVSGMDEGTAIQFRNALTDRENQLQAALNSGTADESELIRLDQIRFLIENLDSTSLRGRHISPRGKQLKTLDEKPAQLAMTEESIVEYLNHVAVSAGNVNWRKHSIDTFESIYGHGGPKQILKQGHRWSDPIEESTIDKSAGRNWKQDMREAQQMQRWLKKTITGTTVDERWWTTNVQSWIRKMEDGDSEVWKATGKLLDSWLPEFRTFINAGRFTSAYTKLLMFGPAQLFVQGSQAVASLTARTFTHPINMPLAISDVLLTIAAGAVKRSGGSLGKKLDELWDFTVRSGYLADITTNDVVELMGAAGPTFARYQKYYQDAGMALPGLRAAGKKFTDSAGRVNRWQYTWGSGFFKSGEGINRLLALHLSRREMESAAKKGILNGLDGNPFKGKIGDTEFIQLTVDKAKETALNMAKPGELQAFSGLGSVLFQFKQVLPKAGHMMFSTNKLSGREKFGAAVGMITIWGPTSIPFLYDIVNVGEQAWASLSGNPTETEIVSMITRRWATDVLDYISGGDDHFFEEIGVSRKFITRLVKRGAINALTDGEIDIVNRIGFGKFISDLVENSDFSDAIVISSVAQDIYRSFVNGKSGSPDIFMVWDRYARNELTVDQAMVQALGAAGRTFSSMGGFARYFEASNPALYDPLYDPRAFTTEPTLKSSSGRSTGILARDPTRGEVFGVNLGNNRLMQYLVGITPGPVVNEIQMNKLRQQYNTAIHEYVREKSRQYKQTRTVEGKAKVQAEAYTELYDTMHLVQELGFTDLAIVKQHNWIHRQVFGKFLTDEMRFFNPTIFGEQ